MYITVFHLTQCSEGFKATRWLTFPISVDGVLLGGEPVIEQDNRWVLCACVFMKYFSCELMVFINVAYH